jgi:hypothetical protein
MKKVIAIKTATKIILFPIYSPFHWVCENVSPEVKQPEYEAECSSPSNVKVKLSLCLSN